MIIENSPALVDKIIDIFMEEVDNVVNTNPEIFTEENKKKFSVRTVGILEHYVHELIAAKPKTARFSSKQIVESALKHIEVWNDKPFVTSCLYGDYEDGLTHIHHIFVFINVDVVRRVIIENLERLDNVFETIKIDARHEMGHVMDHFQLFEGRKIEEVANIVKKDAEEVDEFYRWKKEYIASFGEDITADENIEYIKTSYKKYYAMSAEWRADVLGGINREEAIEKLCENMILKPNIRIELVNKE